MSDAPKLTDYPYGGAITPSFELSDVKFNPNPTTPEDLREGRFKLDMVLQLRHLTVPELPVTYVAHEGPETIEPAARAAARGVAESLTLLRTGLPITELVFQERPLGLEITLVMKVLNRDNPNSIIGVNFTIQFAWYELLQSVARHRLLYAIRHLVHDALTHEADECLFFAGERLNDPHGGDGYARTKA